MSAFPTVSASDITALSQDGQRGRRLYCGNNHGELYLLNFMDGSVIDQVRVRDRVRDKVRDRDSVRDRDRVRNKVSDKVTEEALLWG
jgi:hypothetical protein